MSIFLREIVEPTWRLSSSIYQGSPLTIEFYHAAEVSDEEEARAAQGRRPGLAAAGEPAAAGEGLPVPPSGGLPRPGWLRRLQPYVSRLGPPPRRRRRRRVPAVAAPRRPLAVEDLPEGNAPIAITILLPLHHSSDHGRALQMHADAWGCPVVHQSPYAAAAAISPQVRSVYLFNNFSENKSHISIGRR